MAPLSKLLLAALVEQDSCFLEILLESRLDFSSPDVADITPLTAGVEIVELLGILRPTRLNLPIEALPLVARHHSAALLEGLEFAGGDCVDVHLSLETLLCQKIS